jgi:hypothetical protein
MILQERYENQIENEIKNSLLFILARRPNNRILDLCLRRNRFGPNSNDQLS